MTGTRRWVWTMPLFPRQWLGPVNRPSSRRAFWSFSSWLLDAVEEGALSETSATQVARFLDTEGLPWSVETAYRIPGLTSSEQAWLMASEAWLHQAERRHSRASSRGFDAMWRGQIRPTAEHRSMMRIRTDGLRVQWDSFEQGSLSGSCSWKSGSSRWKLWGSSTDVGAWLDHSEGFPFCRGVVSRPIGGEDGCKSRGLVQRGLATGLGWFGLDEASRPHRSGHVVVPKPCVALVLQVPKLDACLRVRPH